MYNNYYTAFIVFLWLTFFFVSLTITLMFYPYFTNNSIVHPNLTGFVFLVIFRFQVEGSQVNEASFFCLFNLFSSFIFVFFDSKWTDRGWMSMKSFFCFFNVIFSNFVAFFFYFSKTFFTNISTTGSEHADISTNISTNISTYWIRTFQPTFRPMRCSKTNTSTNESEHNNNNSNQPMLHLHLSRQNLEHIRELMQRLVSVCFHDSPIYFFN